MGKTFPHSVNMFNRTYTLASGQVVIGKKKLVRILNDYEIWLRKFSYFGHGQLYHGEIFKELVGWAWRTGMPMVFWFFDGSATIFGEHFQNLVKGLNPLLTMKKARVTFDYMRAFNNGLGKGFDTRSNILPSEYVPLRDYFTGVDLKEGTPDARLDKIRSCGNATHMVIEDENSKLWFDYLSPDATPTLEWMENNPHMMFNALNISYNKQTKMPAIYDFNQGGGDPLRIPFVSKNPVWLPERMCQEVDGIADPYIISNL